MKGAHGTCLSFAERIKAEGFNPSSKGRGGSGVYFWGYTLDALEWYARELAESWWNFCLNRGDFKAASERGCAVIFASFPDTATFLDTEAASIRDIFIDFANNLYRRKRRNVTESDVYDLFVDMMEAESGIKYDIVHMKVAPPGDGYYKPRLPYAVTGYPSCYVAKNLACINIERVEACHAKNDH